MYCSTCGRQVDAGLSYCNQCGARLGGAADPRSLPAGNFNTLLGAVVGIPIVGIAMLFVIVAALKNGMGFKDDFIFAMTFLTFLLLAIAEIGCVIMLITRTKGPKQAKQPASSNYPPSFTQDEGPRGLGASTFEPAQPASVTDRTTKTLERK